MVLSLSLIADGASSHACIPAGLGSGDRRAAEARRRWL
jgi:hypothetical protein